MVCKLEQGASTTNMLGSSQIGGGIEQFRAVMKDANIKGWRTPSEAKRSRLNPVGTSLLMVNGGSSQLVAQQMAAHTTNPRPMKFSTYALGQLKFGRPGAVFSPRLMCSFKTCSASRDQNLHFAWSTESPLTFTRARQQHTASTTSPDKQNAPPTTSNKNHPHQHTSIVSQVSRGSTPIPTHG